LDINSSQVNQAADEDISLRGKRNWPLILGFGLVLVIAILAIIGPDIAPKDPLEEHNIIKIEENWYVPPFDIGTPGYPLGSDRFGRDIYSRLLWGIRPTIIMVLIVAIVRLFIGVIIGLSAGWFTGKTGRFLNGLIQVALALPVLLVALGAIAIVGVELGIWAFIIGLSLTGWVDTALQVREQTRIVKSQVYIEAASAIGATNQQILSNHILKQILPMLLMLFAFEVSSTLMLTAGLGFLGYYIGGDVWVDTDDFVARRISGSPELGQMLATSWLTLTKPWALIAVGTTVFLTVLGFNLIGEGFRQNLAFTKVQRKSAFSEIRNKSSLWFDNYIWHPLIQFFRIKPLRLGLAIIGIFFLLSLGSILLVDAANQTTATKVLALLNQDEANTGDNSQTGSDEQLVATPTGTKEIELISTYDPDITWELFDDGGFTGGPSLSNDQQHLYVASGSGFLYALDPDGQFQWQFELPSGGVGTPAVTPEGDIYISDGQAGLNRITPQGELVWKFQSSAGETSHSGPAIGPNGDIFYTVGSAAKEYVQAVSPEGEGLWETEAKTTLFFKDPDPSPDGKYVFLKDDVFSQSTGEYLTLSYDLKVNRYFSGSDGENYLLTGHKIIQWEEIDQSIQTIDVYEWDSSELSDVITPVGVGVNKDGTSWQLYTTPGGGTSTVWVSVEDQMLGLSGARISGSILVNMKDDLSTLICGGGSFNTSSTDCALIRPETDEPLWQFHLGNYGPVSGGLHLDNYYYVATEDGYVIKIDQGFEQTTASGGTGSSSDEVTSAGETGIIWSYQASDDIRFVSLDGPDGLMHLTTDDDNLHIIKPDGEIYNVIQLPSSPYIQGSDSGRSQALIIEPSVLPDGTIIVVSDENTVYALNNEGDTIWEHNLEFPPEQYPIMDDVGNLYLIDRNAGMNAFDKNGFKWRFQSSAADKTANGVALDPEGNIYYVVTNYSKGFIQAVSSDGNDNWIVETKTNDFYDDLHISIDGKYLALAEVLVSTELGEPIEYDDEIKTDEFIFASNGQNYLRDVHTVYEWQPSPEGIEILGSGMVGEEDAFLRPPLGSSADSNGVIWLYYPESYIGGGIIIAWMSPDGDLLGNHLFDRNIHTMVDIDMESSMLTECIWFEETNSIDCSFYSPYSEESFSTVTIDEIPSFEGGFIDEDYLFVFGENNEIYAIFIGEPISP